MAVWLKPELICEVSYREMTSDGVMRHPSFEGLREDKNPEEVVLEKEVDTKNIVKRKTEFEKRKNNSRLRRKVQENFIESKRRNTGKKNKWRGDKIYQSQQNLLAKRKDY